MKFTTVEQNIKAVKLCHKVGISVRANFIVGTPFDTMETMEKDLQGAIKLNTSFAHFNKFEPYPGSELYKVLARQGYKYDFTKWESHHDLKGALPYIPDGISEETYRNWLVKAHRRYYLRPRYIAKQFLNIRSFDDAKRMWNGMQAVAGL
jgi:radical SAM superfamily enzyme YgiQ (UPF0313 family)